MNAKQAALLFAALTVSASSCATPRTFVMAWTGPNQKVVTMESPDGGRWRHEHEHTEAGTTALGPAIAHDGGSTWMLVWLEGSGVTYKLGVGGTTRTQGIRWDDSVVRGAMNIIVDGGAPAVGHINGQWLVVGRGALGRITAVQTVPGSTSAWGTPFTIATTGSAIADPALARVTIGGTETLVLVSADTGLIATARTSTDGRTWSDPVPIGTVTKDAAVTAYDGVLYAALGRSESQGAAAVDLYRSTDAVTWTPAGTVIGTTHTGLGPGFVIGGIGGAPERCRMLLTEAIGGEVPGGPFTGISGRGQVQPCASTTWSLGPDAPVAPIGGAPRQVGAGNARTAVGHADTD